MNQAIPGGGEQADAQDTARKLGLRPCTQRRNPRDRHRVRKLLRAKADAFFIATDPILLDRREQIVSFAERHALPAVYFVRQFAVAGGL